MSKSKQEILNALVATRKAIGEYTRAIRENKRPDWKEARIGHKKEMLKQAGILEWILGLYDPKDEQSVGFMVDLIIRNNPPDRKMWNRACNCPEHNGIHPLGEDNE